MLLSLSLMSQAFMPMNVYATKKKDAYDAYYKLIKTLREPGEWTGGYDRYKLLFVDDDKIPELLAVDTPADYMDNNGIYCYKLYTYYGGKAVELGEFQSGVASAGGYRGGTMYLEKSGKVMENYISSGSGDGSDIVYKLKKGKLVKAVSGDFHLATDKQEWNGKSVSASAYNKKLNKAFDTNKGKGFEALKTISYVDMRKKLKG